MKLLSKALFIVVTVVLAVGATCCAADKRKRGGDGGAARVDRIQLRAPLPLVEPFPLGTRLRSTPNPRFNAHIVEDDEHRARLNFGREFYPLEVVYAVMNKVLNNYAHVCCPYYYRPEGEEDVLSLAVPIYKLFLDYPDPFPGYLKKRQLVHFFIVGSFFERDGLFLPRTVLTVDQLCCNARNNPAEMKRYIGKVIFGKVLLSPPPSREERIEKRLKANRFDTGSSSDEEDDEAYEGKKEEEPHAA